MNFTSGLSFKDDTPPIHLPLRPIPSPEPQRGGEGEGGSGMKPEALPEAPGGTSPLAQATMALHFGPACAQGDPQKAPGFSQMSSHSLTLSFLSSFPR